MLTALIIVLLSISKNANAEQMLAYKNSSVENIEASVSTTEISVEEQIKANSTTIQRWLEIEVKEHIGKYYIDSERYNVELELIVNKEGKLIDYKIEKADNIEISNLFADILTDAPMFEPVKMNGYAARIQYKVPISLKVR
jgi:hypothetical protein